MTHAQMLLQSTARKDDVLDEVSAFDALLDKMSAFKVFRAQGEGFSTACWYGLTDASLPSLEAAVTTALVGKAVLSLVISRVPEVIDDQLLYRFLPPECVNLLKVNETMHQQCGNKQLYRVTGTK